MHCGITQYIVGYMIRKEIPFEKFLVNKGETAIGKYGDVLMKVIALTTEGE